MAEPRQSLRVFLCYALADRDAVYVLYTRLTHDGADSYERLVRALQVCANDIGTKLKARKGSNSNLGTKPITKQHTRPMPVSNLPDRQKQRGTKNQDPSKGKKFSPKPLVVQKPKAKEHKLTKIEIILALISAAATIIAAILNSPLSEKWLIAKPALTSTSTVAVPLEKFTPMPIPTKISDIDLAGNSITMRLVPAGEFAMGSDYGVNDGNLVHTVGLEAFYMDIYEVTNRLYRACVTAGACMQPKDASSYARNNYYDDVNLDNYPVINVNWYMALSYCEWRGGQLPTEAQWEKAARGGLEGQAYPWGNVVPVCKKGAENGAKFNDNASCGPKDTDTEVVGSYSPNGFGLYDMAGNVWEWTSSLYQPYPYVSADGREDLETYGARVVRGGSFLNVEYLQRVSFRNKFYPDLISNLIGFRCARSIP